MGLSQPHAKPTAAVFATAFFLLGCPSGGQGVLIDLRTDLTPGLEFDSVLTDIGDNIHLQHTVDPNADCVRVGGEALEPGPHRIHVRLVRSGRAVTEREVVVEVGMSNQAVTVLISRDCRGVMCPAGDDPLLTSCLGGRCVDPHCTPETPDLCPMPDCETNADCTVATCAEAECAAGTCFAVSQEDRCEVGEFCEAEGCLSVGACGDFTLSIGETDVDCGGALCPPCRDGLACRVEDDCIGLVCSMNRCVSCQDRMLNADESDVDCGGDFCPPCVPGAMCRTNEDCAIGECLGGICQF